jgi:ribosomal protein L37AE/L43A
MNVTNDLIPLDQLLAYLIDPHHCPYCGNKNIHYEEHQLPNSYVQCGKCGRTFVEVWKLVGVNDQHAPTSFVQTLLSLERLRGSQITWRAALSPSEMLEFAEGSALPLQRALVRDIDALIPPAYFGPRCLNNGRQHHVYEVGMELSRVLYVNVYKNYIVNWNNLSSVLAKQLDQIAKLYKADEHGVVTDDAGKFSFRFWWD